jgi:hypothetical protein
MQVITSDSIYHRTKLMTAQRAANFAKCIEANTLFHAVTVERSEKAKGEKAYFVRYQPSNELRTLDMIAAQASARAERAADQRPAYEVHPAEGFFYCLSPDGEVYETTEMNCDCPDYTYRGAVVGPCKHMLMLRSELPKEQPVTVAEIEQMFDTLEPKPLIDFLAKDHDGVREYCREITPDTTDEELKAKAAELTADDLAEGYRLMGAEEFLIDCRFELQRLYKEAEEEAAERRFKYEDDELTFIEETYQEYRNDYLH